MTMELPFQPPIQPMLAKASATIPEPPGWSYEPKWDGFRAIVYFDGASVYLQSRDLKPLARYFPEVQAGLAEALPGPAVLDGEIVIMTPTGLDFDGLLMRIHPAESRVRMLAAETPAAFVAFDILADSGADFRKEPFAERRERLVAYAGEPRHPLYLSPNTLDHEEAGQWFEHFEGAGFDGVIARPLKSTYRENERTLLKIKHQRTADCVVGGFRWLKNEEGKSVGSLLLGLYDRKGVLHHVGHTSSFKAQEKRDLVGLLAPYVTEEEVGFGDGRAPGGLNRWTQGKDTSWVRLRPELVCEVSYDHLQGNRFRHATTFRRWRPDKPQEECVYAQLAVAPPAELLEIFR